MVPLSKLPGGEPGLCMVNFTRFVDRVKAEKLVLFTPALLWKFLPDVRRVFAAQAEEKNHAVTMLASISATPLLDGLDTWNHVLYAMRREDWRAYAQWLTTVVVRDPRSKQLYKIGQQRFWLPLQLTSEGWQPSETSTLLRSFGLWTTSETYILEQKLHYQPRLRRVAKAHPELLSFRSSLRLEEE